MSKAARSYGEILRSSSIVGGASIVNILVGLVRTKAAAVLLGPDGVGVIGLLQSLMAVAATLFSLGLRTVGTRQIAAGVGRSDENAIALARRTLFWGTLGLATVGACIFWLLRDFLADRVLGEPERGGEIGWLAIGVALSVASGSQSALLAGLRQIGNLARIGIASSIVSTALGVAALAAFGESGVLAFVLISPITSFLLGHYYVSRIGPLKAAPTPVASLAAQFGVMARLGAAFVLSGLLETMGELIVRSLLKRDLGADALGQFQAAWTISMTYSGLVLSAMGVDYYPRLATATHDHAEATNLVNEQTEVALLLAGPILLAVLGLAPWMIALLYTSAFDDSVSILRWQVLGDVLKVASWPLGYLMLALGDGRGYLLSATGMSGLFVAVTWIGLPAIGVQASGVGVLAMYAGYLPLAFWIARRRTGFAWTRRVALLLLGLVIACAAVALSAVWSKWLGAAAGSVLALIFAVYGLARLRGLVAPTGRAGQLIAAGNWIQNLMSALSRG